MPRSLAIPVLLSALVLSAAASAPSLAAEPIFVPLKIDGPVHDPAQHSYWYGPFSECCSVADFDGDGDLDVAAGRNWYEAPDWKKHTDFREGAETNGPETDDNSEFAMDVNRDGHPDIVSSGWMRMRGAFWYENPGAEGLKSGTKWKSYQFHSAKNMEGVIHGDIDGDGDDDILCNHWAPVPGQGMTWYEHIDREPWLKEHVIGTEGEYHGNGLGDINGDGRTDIVTPVGWYEAPEKPAEGTWTFHADYTFAPQENPQGRTSASHPMLVFDVNGDGLNDILVGAAHTYGLAWLEQSIDGDGKRSFQQHWVERDFGQFHTMAMGDLNGDGRPDLVTGKRLFAHHGRDISCYDPLFAFWYDIKDGRFERHILSFNHLPWYPGKKNQNPPPNGAIAVGMKLVVTDMDGDGDHDVVVSGKPGLYIFVNEATAPLPKLPQRLPPETEYPSWVPWAAGNAPAKKPAQTSSVPAAVGEGWVTLFDGGDLSAWTMGPDKSWVVEDGTITLRREMDGKEHNSDYLWTKQTYGDFVLELEFKTPEGPANSGIFLRTADRQDPVYTGIEVQVSNPYGKSKLSRTGIPGAIYDLVAPTVNAALPPGQWNQVQITCRGSNIEVVLNGQKVSAMDLDQWTETGKNPDGTPNKFRQPLKDFARRGYVGLQDHGRTVWYRNIRIRPLE
ncbi:MAG: family 16 glycoside hydrolase [Planctomycetota bacterium]